MEDGIFKNNEALNGGVIYLEDYGASLIQGGLFSGNVAHSGGGAVFVGEDAAIEVGVESIVLDTFCAVCILRRC